MGNEGTNKDVFPFFIFPFPVLVSRFTNIQNDVTVKMACCKFHVKYEKLSCIQIVMCIALTSLKRFRFATLCNPTVHVFKKHCNSHPINTAVIDWLCRNMYFKTKGYQTIFSLRRKSRSLKLFSRASPFERSLSQKRAYVSVHGRVRGFAG